MTPEMIGQDILWFCEGAIRFVLPFVIAFTIIHIYHTR